jgi:predicted alpha/beta superfamily hydrolase
LALGSAGGSAAGRGPPSPEHRSATLPQSDAFELKSQEGRTYTISVVLPDADDPELDLEVHGRQPTPVYALDAGFEFGAVASLSRLMRWGGEIPPVLAVGIGYPDEALAFRNDVRSFDLTPTANPGLGKPDPRKHGGGPAFRRFLTEVVRPTIERRYAVSSENSVLVGHSFGGLFAIDTMVSAPSSFRNYLAISPSLWWDDRLVLRRLETSLLAGATYPGRLAVFAGEREERIGGPKARMTSNVLNLGALVAAHPAQFGAASVKIVPGASHHTIYGGSFTDGLKFLLGPKDLISQTY